MDIGRVNNAAPPTQDSLRKATPDSMPDSHADERSKAGSGPRGTVEEGDGDSGTRAAAESREELESRGPERSKGTDSNNNEAHARRQVTILGTYTVLGSGDMGGEAAAVGVMRGNVGGAARVQGLYVNQRISPWTVHTLDNDVRAVLEAGPRAIHELI